MSFRQHRVGRITTSGASKDIHRVVHRHFRAFGASLQGLESFVNGTAICLMVFNSCGTSGNLVPHALTEIFQKFFGKDWVASLGKDRVKVVAAQDVLLSCATSAKHDFHPELDVALLLRDVINEVVVNHNVAEMKVL